MRSLKYFLIFSFFIFQTVHAQTWNGLPWQRPGDPWKNCRTDSCRIQEFNREARRLERSFNRSVNSSVRRLKSLGWNSFFGLSLDRLLHDYNSLVQVQVLPPNITISNGRRQSAAWSSLPNSRQVISLNYLSWTESPEDLRPFLALHEALGALYSKDENYVFSSLMAWITKNNFRPRNFPGGVPTWLVEGLADYKYILNDHYRLDPTGTELLFADRNGGVTGVGGGGDYLDLMLKVSSLENTASFLAETSNTILLHRMIYHILLTGITPSSSRHDSQGVFYPLRETMIHPNEQNPGNNWYFVFSREFAIQNLDALRQQFLRGIRDTVIPAEE